MNIKTNLLVASAFVSAFVAVPSFAQTMPDTMNKPAMADKMMKNTSSVFKGVEVNGGSVAYAINKGAITLTLSSDFSIPKSPAPHWQIVDKDGNTYLLNQLKIAGDKVNQSIVLPKYIKSVAKVQIWCSFAEVVLGEATFTHAVMAR